MVCSDGRPRRRFCLNRFVVHKAYLNSVSQLQTVQRTRCTVYDFLRHYNIGGVNVEKKKHISLYDEVGSNIFFCQHPRSSQLILSKLGPL